MQKVKRDEAVTMGAIPLFILSLLLLLSKTDILNILINRDDWLILAERSMSENIERGRRYCLNEVQRDT